MKKGSLFVLCGPSGVGKGTVCNALLNQNTSLRLSVSATSRDKRAGEVEGVNYYFVERNKFEEMISNNEFLEYAEVYGNLYGTPKAHVQEKLDMGENVLLEIDPQGAMLVKEKFPNGVFIFILPPSLVELRNRITSRGRESIEIIEQRLNSASSEMSYINEYDYYIINDNIDEAVRKLQCIIEAEGYKVSKNIDDINQMFKEEV